MNLSNNNSIRWWENEPLLMYDVLLCTCPGYVPGCKLQETLDPSFEVQLVTPSHGLQTHASTFMEVHLSNQYSYFKSAQFKENRRDYLAAYLEQSKKAGYRTIVYFNVHAIKPEFGRDHPEWKQIRYDGTTIDDLYGVETAFCVNSPWRDWVRDVCLDLCQYPIDGIFFDGPCLFARACYCAHCKALYRKQYGKEMPPKEPAHPELRQLANFQSESLRQFSEHANRAIKAIRPDVALYGNSSPREESYYVGGRNNRVLIQEEDLLIAEGGFVYGGLSHYPVWKVGSNAKYYQTQAGGKPTAVANSPAHGPWRSYYLSEPEMLLELAQGPIHGSGSWFGGFYWFRKQPAFEKVAATYKFFSDQRDHYFKTTSRARVAILWPEDSINFYGKPSVLHGDFTQGGQKGETVGDIHEEFNGFYDALIKNQVPCDVIDEESVRREDIFKYDLLVLPNVGCTGKIFDDRLREFVKRGGNAIGSFETSICDENGQRRNQLGLSDVFGIRMLRAPLRPYPHFYFFRRDDRPDVFADIHPPLLPAPPISAEVELDGAKMVSPYSVKFTGWDGGEIKPSAFPAITMNAYGKGKAAYLAGAFGGQYWNFKQIDIRLLLRNLVALLSRKDIELENAPCSIELVHRQTHDGSREMISLINYTGGLSRPFERIDPLENIAIKVRTAKSGIHALRRNENLKGIREGEWLRLVLPRLELFETVVLAP